MRLFSYSHSVVSRNVFWRLLQTVTSLYPTFPLKLHSSNSPAKMAADKAKQFTALEGELEQLTSCMKAKKVRPTLSHLFLYFNTLLTANSHIVRGRRWNR